MRTGELDHLFGALADATRREILMALQRGEAPVHELAAHFEMSRPAVSKHLAVLRDAGLVREQRRGRENLYTLQRDALEDARAWLALFWRGKLGALKHLAESEND
jgi:DNA-binding transcriptional ArsR family regulator